MEGIELGIPKFSGKKKKYALMVVRHELVGSLVLFFYRPVIYILGKDRILGYLDSRSCNMGSLEMREVKKNFFFHLSF